MWQLQVRALRSQYFIVSIDNIGHGESDVPGTPFTMDDLSDDIIELIRAVGGGKAIVGGCSMGGQIAQGVGVKAPEFLHGIFISNTGYQRDDRIRKVMDDRALAAEKGMPGGIWTTLNRWFDAEYQKVHPEHVALAYDWLINADPIVHAWSWRAIKGLPYAERLRALAVPALTIAGSGDQSSAPAEVEAMAKALPNGTFRLCKPSGHLAPLEQPRQYAAFLREFAEKVVR